MRRLREALKLFLLACVLLACSRGGCSKPNVHVKMGQLPVDALDAAREMGKSAATEKDADVLAGKLGAFLERLSFPVVSVAGDKLVAKGYMTFPPKRGFLWEPILSGVARATVKGDRRPASVVWRTFVPQATREELSELDLTSTFAEAAKDIAQKKGNTIDAMLVTAIAKDLETRAATEAEPWLDPTATLLLGLWISLSAEKARPGLRPGMPAEAPGMPRGLPGMPAGIPKLPHAPDALAAGEKPPSACAFMEKAAKAAEALGSGAEWGEKVGSWLSDHPAFGKLGAVVSKVGDAATIPTVIAEAVSGMGIAAFVDVTGEGKPTKIRYGDGPVTFRVRVESLSPFSKPELDSFVSCLESVSPGSAAVLKPLRDLPPKGPVEGIPVYWEGTRAYDPTHGKFTPERASVPEARLQQVAREGLGTALGSLTDSGGAATAKFQVRSAGQGKSQGASRFELYTIIAWVFPFPLQGNVAYGGSNLIANRSVPLPLEIEVPLPKDWELEFKENLLATGEGFSGGWSIDASATVPFSLGPNLDFDAQGQGSWSFGFQGGSGVVHCTAPTDKNPFTLNVKGKVQSRETMSTHFDLTDSAQGNVNSKLTCSGPGGLSMSAPLKGPAGGSALKGTPAQSFDMPLRDGQSKSFPITQGSAKGTAKVTLKAKRPE